MSSTHAARLSELLQGTTENTTPVVGATPKKRGLFAVWAGTASGGDLPCIQDKYLAVVWVLGLSLSPVGLLQAALPSGLLRTPYPALHSERALRCLQMQFTSALRTLLDKKAVWSSLVWLYGGACDDISHTIFTRAHGVTVTHLPLEMPGSAVTSMCIFIFCILAQIFQMKRPVSPARVCLEKN